MAVQAHATPHLHPRSNAVASAHFGAAGDLTCNVTTHKKRSREDLEVSHQYAPLPSLFNMPQQQQQHNRLYGSHGTSTTGRTSDAPPVGVRIAQQISEIDAIVQLQADRMRFDLEQVLKQQCRDLISMLGQQVVKRINEKDAELARARCRTVELEQTLRETGSQSQIFFNLAKNNEAVAWNLRSAVEQALLQNAALAASSAERGDCNSAQLPADDAESCCYEGLDRNPAGRRDTEQLRRRTACRVCGEKEVCVLILPCRHLCLCRACEPSFDTCPVCHTKKNASLQVFLS